MRKANKKNLKEFAPILFGNEGNTFAVIKCEAADLKRDPECQSILSHEEIMEVYRYLEQNGRRIRNEGSWLAGQLFAEEPWIQIFPNYLIVSQRGGRDV